MTRYTHTPLEYDEVESYMKGGLRYYVTPDGPYPSITTVLGNTADKGWLDGWKASLGPVKASKETKRCADRGTAVHAIAENYIKNDPDFDKGQDYQNMKLFNQIKIHLHKINNIYGQEIPLFSTLLRIAGRCDLIAEYDGKLSIIDYKTSNNLKEDTKIEDYFLQCTAYSIMIEEMFGIVIEQIVVIIAVEKGIMGQVYKRDRSAYIGELIKRTKKFHDRKK